MIILFVLLQVNAVTGALFTSEIMQAAADEVRRHTPQLPLQTQMSIVRYSYHTESF